MKGLIVFIIGTIILAISPVYIYSHFVKEGALYCYTVAARHKDDQRIRRVMADKHISDWECTWTVYDVALEPTPESLEYDRRLKADIINQF